MLGWVADRYPQLVQRIQAGGHELASHGYWHELVYSQTPEEFAADIRLSRDAIGAASSVHVTAYRAPSFSITQRSLWALDILAEQGYLVDSSIFPISGHDRYGIAGAQREIHELSTPHGTLTEFPPSAWHLRKFSLPIGGGYFRIFPYSLSRRAIGEARKRVGPAMFYTHPWEIDPVQPRIKGTGMKSRFRHYTGLRGTHARLDRMLQHWNFSSMENVLRAHAAVRSHAPAAVAEGIA